jgi:hypothetical protein
MGVEVPVANVVVDLHTEFLSTRAQRKVSTKNELLRSATYDPLDSGAWNIIRVLSYLNCIKISKAFACLGTLCDNEVLKRGSNLLWGVSLSHNRQWLKNKYIIKPSLTKPSS